MSSGVTGKMRDTRNLDLGETELGESHSFPPPERKVITQSYDLSLQTLLERWDEGVLIIPEFQRGYVWDDNRASRLIESLLLNIPIPVVYLAETEEAHWEVIDGHQRIRSVIRYLKNEFPLSSLQVLGDYKRLRFHQLPDREKRYLKARTIRGVVLSPDSHPKMKFEVFERLNTGAVALNAQELRNSLYRGPFNQLLHTLADNPHFRTIMGTSKARSRMLDEELILRFLALHDELATYRPPLKHFLNMYMLKMRNEDEHALERLRSLFVNTIAKVRQTLGKGAFRLTNEKGNPIERTVIRALSDAQLLTFSWANSDELDAYQERIVTSLGALYKNEDFLDLIRRATGDRVRTLSRIRYVVAALRQTGLQVDVPINLD